MQMRLAQTHESRQTQCSHASGDRLVEERNRLRPSGDTDCELPGAQRIGCGAIRRIARQVVLRDCAGSFNKSLALRPFKRLGHPAVQRAIAGCAHLTQRHTQRQAVVEAKVLIAGGLYQRRRAQLVTGIECADFVRLAHLHNQVERELAPDHRRNIERTPGWLAQATDARGNQVANRPRHRCRHAQRGGRRA